jgi:hypothetical protein
MDDVITFESAIFPAARGGDPGAPEFEAAGLECLTHIVEAICRDAIAPKVPPLAEGSGCSAIVETGGAAVLLHLTWFPAGAPGPQYRDVWTLQVGPSGGWLRRALPAARRRGDDAAQAVMAAVERALRERTAEFSEVRRCTWRQLEQ